MTKKMTEGPKIKNCKTEKMNSTIYLFGHMVRNIQSSGFGLIGLPRNSSMVIVTLLKRV